VLPGAFAGEDDAAEDGWFPPDCEPDEDENKLLKGHGKEKLLPFPLLSSLSPSSTLIP
jgi:hypothetical protein